MMDDNLFKLKNILLSNSLKENENLIFSMIPLLKYEKDFDQKSVWHKYDVWNHTINAVLSCDLNFEDRLILLLHDIGKPFSCQEDGDVRHFKGHALKSAELSKNILINLGIDKDKVEEMLIYISNHSSKIDIKDINCNNIDYYLRLLKIQKCDSRAYEDGHAKLILDELNSLELEINRKYKER